MPRILLLGYFGAGNFGDDALLVDWLTHNRLRLENSGTMVDIVCGEQAPLAGFIEGDELSGLIGKLIPKQQALQVNPANYKFMLAPGGSLLQDTTSVRSLAFYLWLIRRFTSAKRRVFMLNQGVGPLHSWVAHFFTPRILAGSTMLSLRDEHSHDLCKSSSSLRNHPHLVYSADPIVMAKFELTQLPQNLGSQDYALFIPRPTGDLPTPIDEITEAQAMASMLDHSTDVTGIEHVLLPLHPDNDMSFCTCIATNCKTSPMVLDPGSFGDNSMSTVWTVISKARLVVSHRLHGVIAAAASGVPAMGVAYDPKVQAFCNEAALPYCFPATIHETQAKDDLRRLWNDRDAVADEMTKRISVMKDRLEYAQERLYELW